MRFSSVIFVALALCASIQAQVTIQGDLVEGTKTINVMVVALKGTDEVRIEVDGTAVKPAADALAAAGGVANCELTLENALKAGQTVEVSRVANGVTTSSATRMVKPKPKVPEEKLQILTVQAYQSDTKLNITFKPIPASVSSATVEVKTPRGKIRRKLSDTERPGGKAAIELHDSIVDHKSIEKVVLSGASSTVDPVDHDWLGAKCGPGPPIKIECESGPPVEVECESGPPLKKVCVDKVTITMAKPVKEGDDHIDGKVSGTAATKVQVRVHRSILPRVVDSSRYGAAELKKLVAGTRQPGEEDDLYFLEQLDGHGQEHAEGTVNAEKEFTIELDRKLSEGEYVSVRPVFGDDGADYAADYARTESVRLNWGRVRGVFTSGAAIPLGSDGDGQAEPYLGFRAEGRILGHILDKTPFGIKIKKYEDKKKKDKDRDLYSPVGFAFRDFRKEWHAFVDTRLTQIETPDSSGNTTKQVSSSQFQFGTYLAVGAKGMDWNYKGKFYSFHFGPLLKGGWQTVDSGVVLNTKTTTVTPADETMPMVVSETRKGLMPFYGYGFRVGFSRYDLMGSGFRNRQVSTDWIGYLDFTWGKNHAFRTAQAPMTLSDVTVMVVDPDDAAKMVNQRTVVISTPRTMEPRFAVEGRLKIPFMPAFIGVDANWNRRDPTSDPNDLRFLVGFRFDANKALGRIFGDINTD